MVENNDIKSEDIEWQKASLLSSLQQSPVIIEKAGFWRRFFAYSIDWWILGIIGTFFSILDGSEGASVRQATISFILSISIPAVYFVWPYSRGGQTLGKRLLGIRVVSIDGSPLTWKKGISRAFGYIPSALAFNLGFLWAAWDDDKQAWQDKMAGTLVLRTPISNEQLQSYIEPSEANRRQKRWLLGLGIPTASIIVIGLIVFASFIQSGLSQVKDMGDWPSAGVAPKEVIDVDLSHLGLELAQVKNSREDEFWELGQYDQGVLVSFESGGNDTVLIWALKYRDTSIARGDFNTSRVWAEENCGFYSWRNLGSSGIIDCEFTDAYNKTLLNQNWILDIMALEGAGFTPENLVDQVLASIADHWKDGVRES